MTHVEYGFDDRTWKQMVQECYDRYPMRELPDHINSIINQYAKVNYSFFFLYLGLKLPPLHQMNKPND